MIRIDKNAVDVGEITPGDKPGYPILVSEPGSYLIASDLDVTSDQGFLYIQADNVTIDLGGHFVSGPGDRGTGNGVIIWGSNASIKNGTIAAFAGWGIHGPEGDCHQISDVLLINNAGGGARLAGNGHRVRNCVARQNAGDGFIIGDGSQVLETIAIGNEGNGICCGSACSVETSVALSNHRAGVIVDTGSVVRGVASRKSEIGIQGEGCVISGCGVSHCDDGIHASSGSVVTNATVLYSGITSADAPSRGVGIALHHSVLDASTAFFSERYGVSADKSLVTRCRIGEGKEDSIVPGADSLIIENILGSIYDDGSPRDQMGNHIARNWINNETMKNTDLVGCYAPTSGDNANRSW